MLNILPREDKFYRLIQGLEAHAGASALLLKDLIEKRNDPAAIVEISRGISNHKREAKKLLEIVNQEIARTLITPFDRDDIQAFSVLIYNIPKQIEKIKERILTHEIYPFNGDFNKFVAIIERQADALSAVVAELSEKFNPQALNAKAAVLDELEDQGDAVLGQLIASSFHDIADVRELMLRKDIYEMLEDVTDLYRDAANVAHQIVLKHS